MKNIKALLAASALATVSATANAAVWRITMDAQIFVPNDNVSSNILWTGFEGAWSDEYNQGGWHGTVSVPGYASTLWFDQTFTMNEVKGTGLLNTFFNCNSNTVSACQAFSGTFQGALKNTQGTGESLNNDSYKQAYAFTPADGVTFQWTLQLFKVIGYDSDTEAPILGDYIPIPMNVTLHGISMPTVPIPATAWLFGSSLIGLAGAVRKYKSA